MKIGVAQLSPFKGEVEKNIKLHIQLTQQAILKNVDALFFPELSITGYEPELADELKVEMNDKRFEVFQSLSNEGKIIIGLGVPTKSEESVQISMLIFHPDQPRQRYSKQLLHEDELPFFVNGKEQILIKKKESNIALAICYESLQEVHLKKAVAQHANIYLASVAKSQSSMDKANDYFSNISKQYSIPILMSNSFGYCDNFESVGQSSVWNKHGKKIGVLGKEEQGILIYDTLDENVSRI